MSWFFLLQTVHDQDGSAGDALTGEVSLRLPPMPLAHLAFYRRDSHPSGLSPHPPFSSILTTLAPCSIHKPRDDKCPPLFVPARIRQYHTALPNIIHLLGHQSGTQKMKCCCSSPFFTERVSHFYSPFSLTAWFLHTTWKEYATLFKH